MRNGYSACWLSICLMLDVGRCSETKLGKPELTQINSMQAPGVIDAKYDCLLSAAVYIAKHATVCCARIGTREAGCTR